MKGASDCGHASGIVGCVTARRCVRSRMRRTTQKTNQGDANKGASTATSKRCILPTAASQRKFDSSIMKDKSRSTYADNIKYILPKERCRIRAQSFNVDTFISARTGFLPMLVRDVCSRGRRLDRTGWSSLARLSSCMETLPHMLRCFSSVVVGYRGKLSGV